MKSCSSYLIIALALLPLAYADEKQNGMGRYLATPLKGDYYIFGGTLGDKTSPTPKDRKVSLMFMGALAKDLFEHIGPDAKNACSATPDYRERNRGDLTCTWTKNYGHSCYLGLDVRLGKSMRGSNC